MKRVFYRIDARGFVNRDRPNLKRFVIVCVTESYSCWHCRFSYEVTEIGRFDTKEKAIQVLTNLL